MDKRDKFRGCLIGGAVGDALGYAVEFSSENEIFSKYGKSGIAEFALQDLEHLHAYRSGGRCR